MRSAVAYRGAVPQAHEEEPGHLPGVLSRAEGEVRQAAGRAHEGVRHEDGARRRLRRQGAGVEVGKLVSSLCYLTPLVYVVYVCVVSVRTSPCIA